LRLVWNDQRFPLPSYALPPNVAAHATVTIPVYVALPYPVLPLVRQLGIWLEVDVSSRAGGQYQRERSF
jgi:hypothetical protein